MTSRDTPRFSWLHRKDAGRLACLVRHEILARQPRNFGLRRSLSCASSSPGRPDPRAAGVPPSAYAVLWLDRERARPETRKAPGRSGVPSTWLTRVRCAAWRVRTAARVRPGVTGSPPPLGPPGLVGIHR